MLNQSDYILCKCDKDSVISYVNDTFLSLMKKRRNDVIGSHLTIFRHPDVPLSYDRFVEYKMKNENYFNGYNYCIDNNQCDFWLFVDYGRRYDTAGESLGYEIFGYPPSDKGVSHFKHLFNELLTIERKNSGEGGVDSAYDYLLQHIESMDFSYDEFVCT
ncbi:PAS domain-containing protein, partial [bacterium AH-315-K03]|nr:PAS domain-containing protein [bacterium AH-315-K03]